MAVISLARLPESRPDSDAEDAECRQLKGVASEVRRRLRLVQADEIELGQRVAAYLAYEILRQGWKQGAEPRAR